MAERRNHLVLGLSLDAAGHHPAAWRLPGFDPAWVTDARHFIAQGKLAESAGLDFLLAGYPVRSSALAGPAFSQSVQLEPLSLISALMIALPRIGLAASVPMAYWEPFNVARAFAALDNLSAGRAAWLAVPASGFEDEANFPRFARQQIDAPYERAFEFAALVRALWDSWEDDALKFDKQNAVFTERSKVHRIAHKGKYFASDGPLNAPRPPQGHPPLLVSDLTANGLLFAAANADLVLASESGLEAAAALRHKIAAPLLLADLYFVLGASEAEARQRAALLDAFAAPLAGLRFVGTAAGLAALMAEWFAAGACDGFNLLPAVMGQDLVAFTAEAMPLLKARGLYRENYAGTTLRDHLGLARPPGRIAQAGAA
jgi:alkanesulfonate monooxygenase SsuD/methylene tetrahydromethanopterin reductase-like flavin-dependent oxidoreductase (luciferase family)